MEKLRIGIMGTGKICDIYIRNIMGMHSDVLELTAVSSLHYENAAKCAKKYGIPNALPEDTFYESDLFDAILNITVPKAHYSVNKRALEAGKHVYSEKPLAMTYEEGLELLKLATDNGLFLGGAPDTFMGASAQAARKAFDEGMIGTPIACTALMLCHGWETGHPNPDFYYAKGGGPMFDMGPYYLTALINLLGPISSVSAMGANLIQEREIMVGPRAGERIPIETPTHVTGVIHFANGAIGSITTSFDVWPTKLPNLTVFGTKGTLTIPDPNIFSGTLTFLDGATGESRKLDNMCDYRENSRGLGLRDMALAIREKREAIASGELMNHVLDAMESFLISAEIGKVVKLRSTCVKPAAFY